jgi:hypothetical protein
LSLQAPRDNGHKRTTTPGNFTGLVLQVTVKADMSIDELARKYIAKIDAQQRAQSTGRFPWIRETNLRAPHFSAGTRLQPTSGGRIHCEECGLRMNGQSICSGCRASPSRLWLQFVSLGTLGVLTAYNYIFALNLLPRLAPRGHLASVVAKCQRIYVALRLDRIRSLPSCLGLLRTEEIWLQLKRWGAGRDRIRCNSSDRSRCTAHISTDGMDLGGTPRNFVGFPPGTRNRCRLGSCSASAGFYLLQLRVTGPTPR